MNATPSAHPLHPLPRRQARGFSLVEILVGVAIGMVGLLVIFKTVAVWDSHTRTTVAGGDAQVAGTLAIFNLERDIKLGGMGFGEATPPVMGCTVAGEDTLTGRTLSFPLYPVQISASGPAGSPDVISVLAGNSSFFPSAQPFTSSTATTKTTNAIGRTGFRHGDVVVVAGNETALPASANCALVQITDNADGSPIAHVAGAYVPDPAYSAASSASRFNAGAGTGSTFTGGSMFNLGPTPQLNRWQTNGRALSRTEFLHGTAALEIADGVINLKADYGVDSGAVGDNIISDSEWTTATPTDWTRVRAIRVAVLVRSSQFEKPAATSAAAVPVAVTASAPAWAGGTFLMTNVDGTADSFGLTDAVPNNWRFYRYRVYEKVIPLRNMIWGTAP
jgi:type IV pilus assembly protein PilW